MNRAQVAELLTLITAFDRRTLGDADIVAWHSVLDDIEVTDAAEAVRRHYRTSSEWIMPADVRRGAAEVVRERSIGQWAPGQFGVPRDQAHPELPPVPFEEMPVRVQDLLRRVPRGNWAALHPRRAAWEREQRDYRRQADARPNPLYDPAAVEALREYWTDHPVGSVPLDPERHIPPVRSE